MKPDHGAPPARDPDELRDNYEFQLRVILIARLMYYLGREPSPKDYGAVRMTTSSDELHFFYSYGTECLSHVDHTKDMVGLVHAWDPISEDEVNGSAPGPRPFHLAQVELMQHYACPIEIRVITVK